MANRKRASWMDLWIALGIGLVCLGLLFGIFEYKKSTASFGVLYWNNEELMRFDLSVDAVYEPDSVRFPGLQIAVSDGAVRFLENDCPDRICVHTGFLRIPGTYAVCLPYRLKLCVESAAPTVPPEVDNG